MPNSISLLIAIEPPNKIKKNILKVRQLIIKKTKKNIYGNHEPHITLFSNTFPDLSSVEKEIKNVIKKHKPFYSKTKGLKIFYSDPSFKIPSNTIVYEIEKTRSLEKLQKDIVSRLNKIRTQTQEKFILIDKKYSKKMTKTIKKYGYLFGPENWIFHSSISSVPENKFKEIWKNIKKYDAKIKWKVKSIGVYINLGDDGFKLYKKYKIK